MPTLIRWLETVRAPEVAEWQQKYPVDWDATDGRNGGTKQTVWEILLEMERLKYRAGEEDLGEIWEQWPWCRTGRRHSGGSVSLWFGLGRRTSASQGRSCGCFGCFEHQRRVQCEGVWWSRSGRSRLFCQGQKWSCFCVLC